MTTTTHGAIEGKLQQKRVKIYNLDVIISVGYRVKSINGTRFRQWATGVLRDRLLHRPSANQQLQFIESRLEAKIDKHSAQISEIQEKVDFFVRTSLPPVEGVTTSPRRRMTVFLLIDDTVYFVGTSFKDLGKKLFAFAKLSQFTCEEILQKL